MTEFKAEKSSSWFQHTIGLLKCLRQSKYGKFASIEQHLPIIIPCDIIMQLWWTEGNEEYPDWQSAIFNVEKDPKTS